MRLTATRSSITSGGGAVLDPITQEDPSLDLNFAYSKALRDDVDSNNPITFTRQSAGTYVGSDGLIKTTPVNLIEYSEDFSSWSAINANASLTPNAATAPDGTLTATSLYAAAAPAFIGDGTSFTVGKFYTFSCHFKAGTGNLVAIFLYSTNATSGYWDNSNINVARAFNLSTGTSFAFGGGTVDPSSWSIEPAGDGWYRCSITCQSTGATSGSNQMIRSLTAPDRDILAWGYQVEEGSAPTDYIPTSGAIGGAPRFDHGPYTRESLGLLVEKARTNLTTGSEDIELYSQQRVSTASNVETAPDGNQTADLVTENTEFAGHYVGRSVSAWTAGKTYTMSIFAKENPNNLNKRYLSIVGVSASFGVTVACAFDLTGEGSYQLLNAGTNPSAAITRMANGWYRCSFTVDATVTTASGVQYRFTDDQSVAVKNYQGDGVSGFYLWGAQTEEGAFPSSYIQTPSGTTVTRAGDVIQIAGDKLNYKNYLEDTERFESDAWAKSRVNLIPNTTTAPDGTSTASTFSENDEADQHNIKQNVTLDDNTVYTASIYVKASGRTTCRLGIRTKATQFPGAHFDLTSGTVIQEINSPISSSIESVGNGWYRIKITADTATGATIPQFILWSTEGTSIIPAGLSGPAFSVWGAQLEKGPVVTDYIPSVETFNSRASAATYVDDATGLIKTTPVNQLRYSERPDQWDILSQSIVTLSQETAPDGTKTAYKVAESTATSEHYVQENAISGVSGAYTHSVFVKAAGRTTVYMRPVHSGEAAATSSCKFDLTAGTAETPSGLLASNSTIKAYPNGWYRISMTVTLTGANTTHGFRIHVFNGSALNYQGDGTSGYYVWGAQVEEGDKPTDYVPTTSIASSAPRYENGELVLEKAATNFVPHSENISNWNTIQAVVTEDAAIAPDGTQTADLVTENTEPGVGHYVYRSISDWTAGKLYTISGFVKINPNNLNKRYVTIVSLASAFGVNIAAMFDLTGEGNYALLPGGTQLSASIKRMANGWYRISMTAEAANTATTTIQFRLTPTQMPPTEFYDGDGQSGFYLWGAQVEEGAFATSYIATDTTAVTRAADVYTSTLGDSGFYNQDKGTVFVSYNKPWSGNWPNYGAFFRVEDTATPTADFINWGGTNGTNTQVYWTAEVGNVSQLPYASYNAPGPGKFSHAVAVASNDAAFAAGGSIRGTDTVVNLPTVNRGVIAATDTQISRIAYFPERLSNDKLNELTK